MFGRKQLLRNFTKADWEGFAGAERPSLTQPPMIGESGVYLLTVDKNGIQVWASGEDVGSDDDHTWLLDVQWPLGCIVAEDMLRKGIQEAMLQALGFTEI